MALDNKVRETANVVIQKEGWISGNNMLLHNETGRRNALPAHRPGVMRPSSINDGKRTTVMVILTINFHFFNHHYVPGTGLGTSHMTFKPCSYGGVSTNRRYLFLRYCLLATVT